MLNQPGSVPTMENSTLQVQRIRRANELLAKPTQWTILIVTLALTDILLLFLAFTLGFWVRFGLDVSVFEESIIPSIPLYRNVVLATIPICVLIFGLFGLYARSNLLGGTREYSLVVRAISFGILGVIVLNFLEPQLLLARGWLLVVWFLSCFMIATSRFFMRRIVYFLRRHGYFMANTILVGANEEGDSLAQQLTSWRTSGLNVVGYVYAPDNKERFPMNGLNALGRLSKLGQLIDKYDVEELILVTSALPREEVVTIFRTFGTLPSVSIRLSSGLYEVVTTSVETWDTLNVPLVRVNKLRLNNTERIFKFALDYFVVLGVLIFIAPLMLFIACLIKLDSPGPVIYKRRVVGRNRKQFNALKFRTMHVNGDDILAEQPELKFQLDRDHKLRDDPRVTRVGKYLRRFSLDELPQLFNVLARQMSIVGPRIITLAEIEKYSKWDMNLLTVNPGLTGLWQVSGRSETTYEKRVQLDMQYIRNWTIWSDIYILLLTIPAVLKGRGAY